MTLLAPSRLKFRKTSKGRIYGKAKRGDTVAFGEFGLQTTQRSRITAAQLEAARVAISRHMKRKGKMWCRVFPQKPVTIKPDETRMGQGKGPVEYYVAVVRPGNIIFEVSGVPVDVARQAFCLADSKLPIRCRFVTRENI
jgi:large subunit ribosomal protein L16